MNIINLCKDIINIEYRKETYTNNLIVCRNLEDIKQYENVMKICYITEKKELNDDIFNDNFPYLNHCIEKIYDNDLNMIFLVHKDFKDTVTFIICGYTNSITNIGRILAFSYGKILQFTLDKYTSEDTFAIANASKKGYKVERNMYNQMYNINKLLHLVDTEYCIKLRSDEYFIDMDEFIEIMKINKKLITTNLFFIGSDYYISDHLFGTNTNDFKNMISNLKDILENKKIINNRFLSNTEKVFGLAYLYDKYLNKDNELISKQKEIINDNFYLYACNRFHDYLVSTVNIPTSSIILNSKYGSKHGARNCIIQKKVRVYIKKNTGYTEDNRNEGESEEIINRVRGNILSINSLEEIKFA
jgi:hypothetical protein